MAASVSRKCERNKSRTLQRYKFNTDVLTNHCFFLVSNGRGVFNPLWQHHLSHQIFECVGSDRFRIALLGAHASSTVVVACRPRGRQARPRANARRLSFGARRPRCAGILVGSYAARDRRHPASHLDANHRGSGTRERFLMPPGFLSSPQLRKRAAKLSAVQMGSLVAPRILRPRTVGTGRVSRCPRRGGSARSGSRGGGVRDRGSRPCRAARDARDPGSRPAPRVWRAS